LQGRPKIKAQWPRPWRSTVLCGAVVCALCLGSENAGGDEPKTNAAGKQPARVSGKKTNTSASSNEALKHARAAIRSGDLDTARALIDAAYRSTRSSSIRDVWRIVESELELERNEPEKSALIAMRIVILRPESEQVGAALYRAGRAYEKIGRASKALELYRACGGHKSTSAAVKKRAEKRVGVLSESAKKK